tara:strand:+ start:215 stop:613 length:399 start_codon:yes stop_codon:yes gene_type:complete
MGNIFSYWYSSNNVKYDDSLLDPLNKEEEIQYASLLDIESINGQVGILEQTTQNSLKNISTDVKYLFDEIADLKNQINCLCERLDTLTTYNEVTLDNTKNNKNSNNKELSVYLDANSNNINEDSCISVEETY